jgi:hypothetical protein
VAAKSDKILRTTKEWIELERVWTKRTKSALLCGSEKSEPKFKLEHSEICDKVEQFNQTEDYHKRVVMLNQCDDRVDEEIFNNLSSRSYFKGLLMLHLSNSQKELASKVKCILNEMKSLLANSQFKDHLNKLDYEFFLKMEQPKEFNEFDFMYMEYMRIREERLNELRLKQEEEERKRLEREQREKQLAEEQKGIFLLSKFV